MNSIKPKRVKVCPVCNVTFNPYSTLNKCCSLVCERYFKAGLAKKERRQKKITHKPLKFYADKCQRIFNEYIRLRDKEEPCISCGIYNARKYDAGHYVRVVDCAFLRYNEFNVHKQCARCNRPPPHGLYGNIINYRKNLIVKIGIDSVNWLEGEHPVKKWTIGELEHLIAHYRNFLKEYKNALP